MKLQTSNTNAGTGRWRRALEDGETSLLSHDEAYCVVPKRGQAGAHLKRLLYFCFLLSAFCFRASGQTYSIAWYKIGGGGGASTNGPYSITGAIGQHDAGAAMTGGNYSLTGGFWSLIAVVQTPGLPNLAITHAGSSVIVSWANTGSGTLQQNNNLAVPAGWTASGYSISTSNGTNSITITPPTGNLFFRLAKP